MHVVIFGAGPLPCEPQYAVTAPGARTWQFARTIAQALAPAHALGEPPRVTVVGLESAARSQGSAPVPIAFKGEAGRGVEGLYIPLALHQFQAAGATGVAGGVQLPEDPHAVVACASAQPYATGAAYAQRTGAPLWVDVFGDPIAENQTQADLHQTEEEANGQRTLHVWKLLLAGLLRGDVFSALSVRQRYALLGQLGAAGRLNQFTAETNLVQTIPYAVFPDELPPLPVPGGGNAATFTVLWCGSFNTWMDVDALLGGFLQAAKSNPRLRLVVVGGRIAGYNDASYVRFVDGIRAAGAEGLVQLLDWQPLGRMQTLYAACDVGLSVDRFTYEAVLGSRTRIANFLAAGKPVLSTVVTELTEDLAREGYVLPFQLNDAGDLARAINEAAARQDELRGTGLAARGYVSSIYNAEDCGSPLAKWIKNPQPAPDRKAGKSNPLLDHWARVREVLGA